MPRRTEEKSNQIKKETEGFPTFPRHFKCQTGTSDFLVEICKGLETGLPEGGSSFKRLCLPIIIKKYNNNNKVRTIQVFFFFGPRNKRKSFPQRQKLVVIFCPAHKSITKDNQVDGVRTKKKEKETKKLVVPKHLA
jgi:hypothetical protein